MFMKKFTAICILLLIPLCAFAAPLKSTATVTENKAIYLTFDDGPTDSVTPKVLDVLEKESVHATFFVIGKQISGREEILRRIAAQGHSVGVHSYSHCYKEIYADADALLKDIAECRSAIRKVLRRYDKMIYRFPGGSFVRPDLRDAVTGAGYNYYDWNASAGDAEGNFTAERLYKNAVETGKGKSPVILLMHDGVGYKETVKALPLIIGYYRQNGYIFKTL